MDVRAHVRTLNEKRLKAAHALQAHIDECHKAHPGETFTAEERATYDRMNVEIDEIEAEARRFVEQETRAAEMAEFMQAHAAIFGDSKTDERGMPLRDVEELRRFLSPDGPRQMRIPITPAIRAADLRRQGAQGKELRSLLWDTGSVGSGVPTLMAQSIYEVLEAQVAMLRMPTTKIPTPSGANFDFPKLTTHTLGTQVIAQGTAIGGTDPGFDKTSFKAYKYGALIPVASEVIEDTAFDILGLVMRDAGRAVGRLVDADLVVGTGTGEPHGVMTAAIGSVVTGGSLLAPTYETLIDLKFSVNDEYRSSGGAAWLMRDSTAGTLMKIRDGAGGTVGAPLWQSSLTGGAATMGQPATLFDHPAFTDVNVASMASNARIIAFGDFSAYHIRHVNDVVLERDDSLGFDRDLVYFRAKWRVDGRLMDTDAIKVMRQNA